MGGCVIFLMVSPHKENRWLPLIWLIQYFKEKTEGIMPEKEKPSQSNPAIFLPIGVGVGVAIGAAIGKIGVGIAIGTALGTIANLIMYQMEKKKE